MYSSTVNETVFLYAVITEAKVCYKNSDNGNKLTKCDWSNVIST